MTSDTPHQGSPLHNRPLDNSPLDNTLLDSRFDHAARSAHAASLGHLSPRVQAQLALRRRAALAQDPHRTPQRAWPMLALGSAAALTLAVGLFVLRGGDGDELPATPGTVVATPSTGAQPIARTASDSSATANAGDRDAGKSQHTAVDAPDDNAADIAAAVAHDMTVDEELLDSFIDDDALPAELLAAEFGTADDGMSSNGMSLNSMSLSSMGFDTLDESPDFYLWLGSQDAQADVTESL